MADKDQLERDDGDLYRIRSEAPYPPCGHAAEWRLAKDGVAPCPSFRAVYGAPPSSHAAASPLAALLEEHRQRYLERGGDPSLLAPQVVAASPDGCTVAPPRPQLASRCCSLRLIADSTRVAILECTRHIRSLRFVAPEPIPVDTCSHTSLITSLIAASGLPLAPPTLSSLLAPCAPAGCGRTDRWTQRLVCRCSELPTAQR